jgi:hypothetical protein
VQPSSAGFTVDSLPLDLMPLTPDMAVFLLEIRTYFVYTANGVHFDKLTVPENYAQHNYTQYNDTQHNVRLTVKLLAI